MNPVEGLLTKDSELRAELGISCFGLESTQFPAYFPSPPTGMVDFVSQGGSASPDSTSAEWSIPREQHENMNTQSWMYYMAETSLRRLCHEILDELYQVTPEDPSDEDLLRLAQQAKTYGEHLDIW
jgi:hypothetical protein